MRLPAILILSMLLCSCQQQQNPPNQSMQVKPTEEMENVVNSEQFVRNYFDTFNRHDWNALASMYSPDAEFKDPSLGPGIVKQSREDFIQKYSQMAEMFSDIKDTVVSVYPSGSKNIVVEFISSGTAPDGSKFELPICTIFEIDNGLITKDFTYYDNFEE